MLKADDKVRILTLSEIGDKYDITVTLDTNSGEHSYYIEDLRCYIAIGLLGVVNTIDYLDEDDWPSVLGYLWHPALIELVEENEKTWEELL